MIITLESIKIRYLKRVLEHIVYLMISLVLLPGYLVFETCIVLPSVTVERSIPYFIHLIAAFFFVVNILGNFICAAFINTSITGIDLSSYDKEDWSFCTVCECMRPPRAWHCKICNTCILKRDHHCSFLACCVGYYNMRYFMCITMHVFVSMVYSFILNIIFVSQFLSWNHGWVIAKFLFPIPMAIVFLDVGAESCLVLILIFNLTFLIFTLTLLYLNFNNILKGITPGEKNYSLKYSYDLGWKNNLVECFGSKWYFTWFCPFVQSPLPGDGVQWVIDNKFKVN